MRQKEFLKPFIEMVFIRPKCPSVSARPNIFPSDKNGTGG
jgi:hypothetical protein